MVQHLLHQAFHHPYHDPHQHSKCWCVRSDKVYLSTATSQQIQEDDNEVSTARVPIVLATQQCSGGEQAITACPNFQLRRPPTVCRHESDVHLVCYNGPNPGVTTLCGRLNSDSVER